MENFIFCVVLYTSDYYVSFHKGYWPKNYG